MICFMTYVRVEDVLVKDMVSPQGHPSKCGHHFLNGDVPVEDVLDRDVLGGDIMSAKGRWGHLCPFLLLPLSTLFVDLYAGP